MADITNANRAEWAESALVQYASDKGMIEGGESMETAVVDLLCDLQHLARLNGLDFADIASRATDMSEYEAQTEDEGAFIGSGVWARVSDDEEDSNQ